MLTAERANHYGGQGWFALALAVKPDDPGSVLSAGLNVFRSTDAGKNWDYGTRGWPLGATYWPEYVHVDQHAITFHPANPARSVGGLGRRAVEIDGRRPDVAGKESGFCLLPILRHRPRGGATHC